MFRTLLLVSVLAAFAKTAPAQFTHADVVAHGTNIEFVLGGCGQAPTDAEGQLTFCDADGNVGIVRGSTGLMDRGVLQIAPNHADGDEVYVTRFGVSRYRARDRTWTNLPEIALRSEDGGADVQTALVNGDGDLVVTVGQDGSFAPAIYVFDAAAGTLQTLPLPEGLSAGGASVSLAYDEVRNGTWVLAGGFFSSGLGWYPDGGTEVGLSFVLDARALRSFAIGNLAYARDRLLAPTSEGLAVVDVTDGQITRYDASTTQTLPFDATADVSVSPDGTVAFVTSGTFAEGAVSRIDLATGAATSYTYPDQIFPERGANFGAIAAGSTTELRLVTGRVGEILMLDTDAAGNGAIVPVDTAALRAAGALVAFGLTDVRYRGQGVYAYGAAVPSNNFANEGEPEVVIAFPGGRYGLRNDDAPGNFSHRMSLTDRHAYADEGGVWYTGSEGALNADLSLRPNSGLLRGPALAYYDQDLYVDQDAAAVSDGGALVSRRELVTSGADVASFHAPRAPSPVNGAADNVGFFAPYGDEVWGYRPFTDFGESVIEVYARGALRTSYVVADDLNSPEAFCVDVDGMAWVLGRNSGGAFELLRYDPLTGEATREEPDAALGRVFALEPARGGGIYVVGEEGVLLYSATGSEALTSTDDARLTELFDAAVDTAGVLHLSTLRTPVSYLTVAGLGSGSPSVEVVSLREFLPMVPLTGRSVARGQRGDTYFRGGDGNPGNFGAGAVVRLRGDGLAPGFRPQERGSAKVEGRVFVDRDGDGEYTPGTAEEGIANVTLAVYLVRGPGDTLRSTTVTGATGLYTVRVPGGLGAEAVAVEVKTVPTALAPVRPGARVAVALPTDVRAVAGPDFELQSSDLRGVYVQTVARSGIWGFEREGFRNAYTVALTNLDPVGSDPREVNMSLLYFNNSPDAPPLPELLDVRVTALRSLALEPMSNYLAIDPVDQSWSLPGVDSAAFEVLAAGTFPAFGGIYGADTVQLTLPEFELPPYVTVVYEIVTEQADPTGFEEEIWFGVASVSAGGGAGASAEGRPLIDPLGDPLPTVAGPGRLAIPCGVRDCGPDAPIIFVDPPMRTPIRSSYDPNDKAVDGGVACAADAEDPARLTCVTETPLVQRALTYTIRFENEGNFSARDVVVVDTLDGALDGASLRYVGASHVAQLSSERIPPPATEGAGGDTLTVVTATFAGIDLDFADGRNDGYIRFGVSLARPATEGLEVTNRGSIYFDQNPPIRTNAVVNRFTRRATALVEPAVLRLGLSPNPARTSVGLALPADFGEVREVRIYGAGGRRVGAAYRAGRLEVGGLAAGMYVVEAVGAAAVARGRVVVE